MQLSRAKIQALYQATKALRGIPKIVRDKDGHPVLRASEKAGDQPQPVFENMPFNLTIKARYAAGRTYDACLPIAVQTEESTNAAIAAAIRAKNKRLKDENPKAATCTDILPSDPENNDLTKGISDLAKESEEIQVHQTPIEGLNLASNPDISPEMLAGLLPMLTGEL